MTSPESRVQGPASALEAPRRRRPRGPVLSEHGATRRRVEGFSLIELMVVITILALLAGVVSVRLFSAAGQARRTVAKTDIASIGKALGFYKLEKHKYPSELRELLEPTKNWAKGFVERIPKDPWGNDYLYQRQDAETFLLKSLGANGQEGGEGEDADISNQDEDE